MDTTTTGYVYAIKSEQLQLVKIGFSKDPDTRFDQLSQQSPVELSFVAIWKGNYDDEAKLHKALLDIRARGEWFEMSARQAVLAITRILGRSPIWRPQLVRFDEAHDKCPVIETDIAPPVQRFTASHLDILPGAVTPIATVFAAYMAHCDAKPIDIVTIRAFARAMRMLGFVVRKYGRANQVCIIGVALKQLAYQS